MPERLTFRTTTGHVGPCGAAAIEHACAADVQDDDASDLAERKLRMIALA